MQHPHCLLWKLYTLSFRLMLILTKFRDLRWKFSWICQPQRSYLTFSDCTRCVFTLLLFKHAHKHLHKTNPLFCGFLFLFTKCNLHQCFLTRWMAHSRLNEIFARMNERRGVNEFSAAKLFYPLVLVLSPRRVSNHE